MGNELVERIESNEENFNPSLPVTRAMLDGMVEKRKLLKEFVNSQLVKNTDYGVIPGTPRPSLFKPGAEKLRGLFGLNVTVDCTGSIINDEKNFAMFTYKAKVFRGDNLIAECEGSTNSQEKKYKERKAWVYSEEERKKVPVTEVTPIYDILNTLQKMAQKRAFVGAIIFATGASDFFTQDIDDPEDASTVGAAPREAAAPSAVPKPTTVSNKPRENRQNSDTKLYQADVGYEDRQDAKDAGFRFDAKSKRWLKELTQDEIDAGFPFEVTEV